MSRTNNFGSSLTAAINRYAKATGRDIEGIHRGVALRLFTAVVQDTPVLTGRLQANWLCTLNQPATGTSRATVASNLQDMEATVSSHTPGQAICLANNLPYAARIEFDGWSHTKAPAGMVRKNVTRFRKLLREETRRTKQR